MEVQYRAIAVEVLTTFWKEIAKIFISYPTRLRRRLPIML